MTLDEKLRAIRDVIEHDIGNRGLARDPECNLINAFPDDFANACLSIAEHRSPRVAIVTGFYIANAEPPCGETDGPLGAVYLARSLQSFQLDASIITDDFCEKSIEAGIQACGARDSVGCRQTSDRLPREITHLIAIERVGPASDGRCYSMRGRDITAFMATTDHLFPASGLVTIGIGDGGNEIGMGKILIETIERNIPNGRQIACRVPTDHLIVAGISNWGAYALAAGVALVRGVKLDPSLFDPEIERKILEAMVANGPLVDGVTGKRAATVDGVAFDEYIQPMEKIRKIVNDAI